MRVVEINTTAYSDENLFIITDLTDDEIGAIIEPMVLAERDEDEEYDNEMLFDALKKAYPKNIIFDGESHFLSF
jgi:hypothetical protein